MLKSTETRTDIFTLKEGDFILRHPAVLTSDDLNDIKEFLEIKLRVLERMVVDVVDTGDVKI